MIVFHANLRITYYYLLTLYLTAYASILTHRHILLYSVRWIHKEGDEINARIQILRNQYHGVRVDTPGYCRGTRNRFGRGFLPGV